MIGMIFRVIPMRVLTIAQLLLPPVLKKIAAEERGLVLVTGTTGSGKTTTLAAMIDDINSKRTSHVMTVEDPIEFLHRDKRSIISQREIGVDTNSFSRALRNALRQDPDVILVGKMRDFETIETALLAAETGHLVFSTLHTLDATETINRIIAVFQPHHQQQIRIQLAGVLKAAISQRLIPKADGYRSRARPSRSWSAPRSSATASSIGTRRTLFATPSPRGPRSTACRRSTSRSSGCTSRRSSHRRRRCVGRPTWTNSS